jgi:hypothetical protein
MYNKRIKTSDSKKQNIMRYNLINTAIYFHYAKKYFSAIVYFRLRVFENSILRRIFGPKRDEVTEEWRKLHNEELNYLYCSPTILRVIKSKRMKWVRHVARMGEGRGVHKVLVRKPEVKRPLGRPRRSWVDNIKMDLQELGCGVINWIELAQDRNRWRAIMNAVMNLRVP